MTLTPLKIKDAVFKSPVISAPMAGVTDAPFRTLLRRFGDELTYTEMILADSLVRSHVRTGKMAACRPGEAPVAVQLCGARPDAMAEAARRIEEQGIASLIDLNMGCPVAKIVKSGCGAALMQDAERAERIVRAVCGAVSLPVSVKFRLGWDNENRNYADFGKRMEQAGASAVTLHARTRMQMYGGTADWVAIGRLKAILCIPVIANGDVRRPEDAARMLRETGADGVMIGRGMLGKPWLLHQCTAFLEGRSVPDPEPRLSIVLEHLKLLEEYYGERKAVFIARKHMAWYSLGTAGGAAFRAELNQIGDPPTAKTFVTAFFKGA
ncbi:MAG: tRNA dihydrouridine synthase DusB [Alphaproteobacteria bacterium]